MLVLLFAGCTAEEGNTEDGADESVQITGYSIDNTIPSLTRSSDTTLLHTTGFVNGDLINVYSYNDGKLLSSGQYKATGTSNGLEKVEPIYWSAQGTADILGLYPSSVTPSSTNFTVKYNQTANTDYKSSDLMVALNTNQSKASNPQQSLSFNHKLARVKVVVTCADGFTATIKEIRMMNVFRTVNINPQTGTVDADGLSNVGNVIMQDGGTTTRMTAVALVPPQTIDQDNKFIEIDTSEGTAKYNPVIKYNDTQTYTITELKLESGKSYTINLSLKKSKVRIGVTIVSWSEDSEENLLAYFNYTGNEQWFTVPADGTYSIKAWGAQGGNVGEMRGGYGGYAESEVALNAGQQLYIYVGGAGQDASTGSQTLTGGWNGGGDGMSNDIAIVSASGGGASHVATRSGLRSEISLNDVIVIAGGGGGATNSHVGGDGCDEFSGGYLANNGNGQSSVNTAGGGAGSQGGRNDVGFAYGGSGYCLNGEMYKSNHTGNGTIRISRKK